MSDECVPDEWAMSGPALLVLKSIVNLGLDFPNSHVILYKCLS